MTDAEFDEYRFKQSFTPEEARVANILFRAMNPMTVYMGGAPANYYQAARRFVRDGYQIIDRQTESPIYNGLCPTCHVGLEYSGNDNGDFYCRPCNIYYWVHGGRLSVSQLKPIEAEDKPDGR